MTTVRDDIQPGYSDAPADTQHVRRGLLLAVSAYFCWGFFPLYFKAVSHVLPVEMVCHRIVWSVVFLGTIISLQRKWSTIAAAFAHRRTVAILAASTSLITINWLVFIYAIGQRQVLQSSLGY